MTDADLSRKLCELMEPEPPTPAGEDLEAAFGETLSFHSRRSDGGWWTLEFSYEKGDRPEWQSIPIDDNAMRRVREELKRRGLREPFVQSVRHRIGILPGLPDTLDVFDLIDAPLSVQIAAAVEVMEKEKSDDIRTGSNDERG